MKPLVKESFRNKEFEGVIYKRRLRISPYNAILIDKALGTFIQANGYKTRFVVLDAVEDIKKACEVLCVPYKEFNTYFDIDLSMCSFRATKNKNIMKIRVYLLDLHKLPVSTIHSELLDDNFMSLAEEQGTVYSLSNFAMMWNTNQLDSITHHSVIRIIQTDNN